MCEGYKCFLCYYLLLLFMEVIKIIKVKEKLYTITNYEVKTKRFWQFIYLNLMTSLTCKNASRCTIILDIINLPHCSFIVKIFANLLSKQVIFSVDFTDWIIHPSCAFTFISHFERFVSFLWNKLLEWLIIHQFKVWSQYLKPNISTRLIYGLFEGHWFPNNKRAELTFKGI